MCYKLLCFWGLEVGAIEHFLRRALKKHEVEVESRIIEENKMNCKDYSALVLCLGLLQSCLSQAEAGNHALKSEISGTVASERQTLRFVVWK